MADDEYRFAVEDVGGAEEHPGESSEGEDAAAANAVPDAFDGADERPPLEPGSPSLENALFVLLGVLATLFAVVRVVGLVGG